VYERTMTRTARTRAPSGANEENKGLESLSSKYRSTFSSFSADSMDDRIEESKLAKTTKADISGGGASQMQKINETEFLATF